MYYSSWITILNLYNYILYQAFKIYSPVYIFPYTIFGRLDLNCLLLVGTALFILNTIIFDCILRKYGTYKRIIYGSILLLLNSIFTFLLLPIQLIIAASYLSLLMIYTGTNYYDKVLSQMSTYQNKQVDYKDQAHTLYIRLLHNETLEIFRLSIWGVITVIIGILSVSITLMARTGVFGLAGRKEWGHPMGQIIYLGILMLYIITGIIWKITLPTYQKMSDIKNRLIENSQTPNRPNQK